MASQTAPKPIPLDGAMATILAAIDEADRERLAQILSILSTASTKASSRLLALPPPDASDTHDRNIDVNEAGARLGMSRDWMYRNAGKLPFTVRINRRVVFSERGIERFIKQRSGR